MIAYRAPGRIALCAHTPNGHTISSQTAFARFPCPKTSLHNSPRIPCWHKAFSLCATPRAVATLSSPRRGRSHRHCLEHVSVHLAALAGYRVAKQAAPASACAGLSHRPTPIVLRSSSPRCPNTRHLIIEKRYCCYHIWLCASPKKRRGNARLNLGKHGWRQPASSDTLQLHNIKCLLWGGSLFMLDTGALRCRSPEPDAS